MLMCGPGPSGVSGFHLLVSAFANLASLLWRSEMALPFLWVTLLFSWPAKGRTPPPSPHSTFVALGISLPTELGFPSKAHTCAHHTWPVSRSRTGGGGCGYRDQLEATICRPSIFPLVCTCPFSGYVPLRGMFIDPLADRADVMSPAASH